MSSQFRSEYPDFAAIERHIRRAHAERAVAVATLIAEAVAGAIKGTRSLFARPRPQARRRGLVVRAAVPR